MLRDAVQSAGLADKGVKYEKRVVALGMAAIMAMSLVGCGSKGDSGSDSNQSANIPTLDSIETDDKGYAEAYKDVKATSRF